MRKSLFIFSLILIACTDQDVSPVVETGFNDPNWLKLEIPNGREAYAITGSIDDTLLVTTWTKAYYTADQGETWKESYDFHGPVPGLLERNDTIFSLEGHGQDLQGFEYASIAQYFTLDHGNRWKYTYHPQLRQRIGVVTSSSGTEYFLKKNITPFSPGSTSGYVNPTDIMKRSAAGVEGISFPYKHNIQNLYIDSESRLYIAASGGIYDEKTNTFSCCVNDAPAIVYVSKRPIP